MSQKTPEDAKSSFREFLSAYRTPILIILLIAFAWRLVLVVGFPRTGGDEPRYRVPAVNILAGHGFSSDVNEPILPSMHTMPLYSLFVAGVFAVFGEHNSAVLIAQSAIDLITCLLVAFIAFSLSPPSLRRPAAIAALIIYGCLCWFTVSWTRYVLTETLATFMTMLAVTASIIALRKQGWRWLVVGLICGIAILVRADSVLLVGAIGLFLTFQILRLRSLKSVLSLLLFCSAIPIVMTPWIVRNYVAFGKFQPFSASGGLPRGGYVPGGYLWWIRTWMTDQTHYRAYHPVLFPGLQSFDPRELPDDAFDSPEERAQVILLIDQYHRQGKFTPELNDQFQVIANERIKRSPIRFFVWLPIQRMTGMWLTGFATTNRLARLVRILLVLPILIGGILGFVFWARNPGLVGLLLLIILTRTLFFGLINSSEHYIVEAYPLVIAACGVTSAALWSFIRRRWTATWPPQRIEAHLI
jgi:4-amino-4-deoxy-L-arabinose transferase-like glycosyltransferase